jgi:hypothetical protein
VRENKCSAGVQETVAPQLREPRGSYVCEETQWQVEICMEGKPGLENRDYGHRGSAALATRHYPRKKALTSPTSGGRSVGIVCLQAKASEFVLFFVLLCAWVRVQSYSGSGSTESTVASYRRACGHFSGSNY